MRLHEPTLSNRIGKLVAPPLSRIICSMILYRPVRALDAYLNFLMGKGAGTGWDLRTEVEAAVLRMHRRPLVVFDVGANVGTWSKCFLEEVPGSRLFLFEPSPACQRAISSLGLPGAVLVPSAVGESVGRARLHFSSDTDGSASLHERGDSYFKTREYAMVDVDVVTLDHVIETERLPFVDFVKMDIEGHEIFALRGARDALKAGKIGALSFEFGSGNINSKTFFRDFWELLSEAGFRVWRITPGGRSLALEDYYEDCEYFRGVTNYIAELKDHPHRSTAPEP